MIENYRNKIFIRIHHLTNQKNGEEIFSPFFTFFKRFEFFHCFEIVWLFLKLNQRSVIEIVISRAE